MDSIYTRTVSLLSSIFVLIFFSYYYTVIIVIIISHCCTTSGVTINILNLEGYAHILNLEGYAHSNLIYKDDYHYNTHYFH